MKTICALIVLSICLTAQAGWMWTGAVSSAWLEIQANGQAGPALTNSFTMSAWFMRTVDRGATRAVLIAKGNTQPNPPNDHIGYELSIVTNHLRFRYNGPGGGVIETWEASAAAPNTNELAHVSLRYTYGNSTSLVMFVNGVNSSGSWIVGTGTVPSTNGNKSMMFGQDVGGTPFMGLFNEIAIWTSILTDREVVSLYTTRLKRFPLTVSRDTLVGYWPLDGWPEFAQQTTDSIPFALNMKPRLVGEPNWYGSFEGFGGLVSINERMFSYPPNE